MRPHNTPTYAGIGSRRAPPEMLRAATATAAWLADKHWVLRTGHAPGMDQAFEAGAGYHAEVFLPWPSFYHGVDLEAGLVMDRPTPAAYDLSAEHHPNWRALSDAAKSLHARNAHQILGRNLDNPVSFVVCWQVSPGSGGTEQALRIARSRHIDIYTLDDRETLREIARNFDLEHAHQ